MPRRKRGPVKPHYHKGHRIYRPRRYYRSSAGTRCLVSILTLVVAFSLVGCYLR